MYVKKSIPLDVMNIDIYHNFNKNFIFSKFILNIFTASLLL